MDFVVYLIQIVIKMIMVAGVAFGGIRLGKLLRDRKTAKEAAESEK